MSTIFPAPARTLLSRFRRQEEGLAAIEFALIAPLLVMFLLGTTMATQSLWAHGKIAQVSSVVGDLVSQETDLDAATFESIIRAAPVLMEPFAVGDLKIIVTAAIACHEDPDDTADSTPEFFTIWSVKWNGGTNYARNQNPGARMTDAPAGINIAEGDYIIRTEATHTYEPAITQQAGHTLNMKEVAYHQPRSAEPVSFPRYENATKPTCNDLMDR